MPKELSLEVWSDVICPWCAIGDRRLDAALARFAHSDAVDIRWRAFELDPSAPRVREGDQAGHLAKKYGRTRAQAEQMIGQVAAAAAGEGLAFQLLRARSGNTFDAHRLLCLAAERGKQAAVKSRFFRGYMSESEAIGEHATLLRLATEAGLAAEEVADVLATDRYAAEVRADEAKARALGVTGVPFFLLGGRLAVSGAQPADVLVGALEQAWASAPEGSEAAGAACGVDGCA